MNIQKATALDVPAITRIYASARDFMRRTGNPSQWAGAYPGLEEILLDLQLGRLYVCKEAEEILGVFCFFQGVDPTYLRIDGGNWINEDPYGVIHRIAVSENAHGKGVASACFEHCYQIIPNLRIDTHRDNLPMQKALAKNGFIKCGVIYLKNGEERIAFQKC